jgi:hypothetical protein
MLELRISKDSAVCCGFDVVTDKLGISFDYKMTKHMKSLEIKSNEDDHASDEELINKHKVLLEEDVNAAIKFHVKENPLLLTNNISLK